MDANIDVLAVRTLQNFELDLSYADGSQRRFDMKLLLTMKPRNKIAALPVFTQPKWLTAQLCGQAILTLHLRP
jgi:hypothetical protein